MKFEQLSIEFDPQRERDEEEKKLAAAAAAKNNQTPLGGTVEVKPANFYAYTYFNSNDNYEEVKRLSPLRHLDRKTEAVYRNKNDGSQIKIQSDKIIIDNTPDNVSAALDIAQDKGWSTVKIKGGSRKSQAALWYEASKRGLEVTGYKPSKEDLKRLEGFKLRQKEQEEENKALDIKPQKEQKEKVEEAGKTKPAPAAEAVKEKKSERQKEELLSQDQTFNRARNEIMAEVQKVMPLNEQERHELESTIDEQLAYAARSGRVNVKGATDTIRKTLPIARQELDHAANAERKAAKVEVKQSEQSRGSNTKETQRKNEQVKTINTQRKQLKQRER